jgi:hypothetical protein
MLNQCIIAIKIGYTLCRFNKAFKNALRDTVNLLISGVIGDEKSSGLSDNPD